MRAILIREPGAPETLEIEEVPTPVVGHDEVPIEVRAIGVNDPDLLVNGGHFKSCRRARFPLARLEDFAAALALVKAGKVHAKVVLKVFLTTALHRSR